MCLFRRGVSRHADGIKQAVQVCGGWGRAGWRCCGHSGEGGWRSVHCARSASCAALRPPLACPLPHPLLQQDARPRSRSRRGALRSFSFAVAMGSFSERFPLLQDAKASIAIKKGRGGADVERMKRTRAATAAASVNLKQRCGTCRTCMNKYAVSYDRCFFLGPLFIFCSWPGMNKFAVKLPVRLCSHQLLLMGEFDISRNLAPKVAAAHPCY